MGDAKRIEDWLREVATGDEEWEDGTPFAHDAAAFIAELDALRAENAALKAQWESAPWKAISDLCDESGDYDHDGQWEAQFDFDAAQVVRPWLKANAPKEEPRP